MKNQQGFNGSVHTKTSANKRLIKMDVRDLQHIYKQRSMLVKNCIPESLLEQVI